MKLRLISGLSLTLIICTRIYAEAAATTAVPAATNLFAHLNRTHPRLLASGETFTRLKEASVTNAVLKRWRAALKSDADEILNQAPSRYEIPDGLRLLETSRRVMNRIYLLGLTYQLDGERRYAERAWQEVAAAAEFQDWNPRHFLDTAEMTHAFAIAYDWLYDAWTEEQRATLRRAIVEKGFQPALKVYRARNSWAKMRHNWNQVCNGGIGMGALALADVEPQLCGEILHGALESLPLAMAEFAPDGAWKEGPGYWNYATTYNVIFLAALDTSLGTDFGLSTTPGFDLTGLFPLYLTGSFGRTFNYADGGDRAIRAPQMFWLAQRFHQPVFAWYERSLAAPAPLDLVWFEGEGAGPKSGGLPTSKYFRGAEVAVLRSAWEDPKALFAGFKAGDNKANHSHLDLGSFVFDALGVRWAMDLGSDNYNLPGYFGNKRWEYYRLRAEGQNTLVINPGAGPDQEPSAATRIIRFEVEKQRSFAIADLTAAYKHSATRVERGLALINGNQLLVQDEIQAGNPAEVWWFMHTPASVRIEGDGRSAVLKEAGAQLRAQLLSPASARFELREAQPLPGSPHPDRQAKNEGVKKLAVHLDMVTDSRLVVLLVPVVEGRASPSEEALHLSALAKW